MFVLSLCRHYKSSLREPSTGAKPVLGKWKFKRNRNNLKVLWIFPWSRSFGKQEAVGKLPHFNTPALTFDWNNLVCLKLCWTHFILFFFSFNFKNGTGGFGSVHGYCVLQQCFYFCCLWLLCGPRLHSSMSSLYSHSTHRWFAEQALGIIIST